MPNSRKKEATLSLSQIALHVQAFLLLLPGKRLVRLAIHSRLEEKRKKG
jgi:hypothetical protein